MFPEVISKINDSNLNLSWNLLLVETKQRQASTKSRQLQIRIETALGAGTHWLIAVSGACSYLISAWFLRCVLQAAVGSFYISGAPELET